MTIIIVALTIAIFCIYPKITYCNALLCFITCAIVSVLGKESGPVSFFVVYSVFALIAYIDNLQKTKKAENEKNSIAQKMANAMRDNVNERNNRNR